MLTTKLASTAIESMEYNRKTRTLSIVFHSNTNIVYQYHNISRYMADVLRFSKFPGKTFRAKIRNKYQFTKVVA